jgi:hypothetical protein
MKEDEINVKSKFLFIKTLQKNPKKIEKVTKYLKSGKKLLNNSNSSPCPPDRCQQPHSNLPRLGLLWLLFVVYKAKKLHFCYQEMKKKKNHLV